jgi:hypothetical protein
VRLTLRSLLAAALLVLAAAPSAHAANIFTVPGRLFFGGDIVRSGDAVFHEMTLVTATPGATVMFDCPACRPGSRSYTVPASGLVDFGAFRLPKSQPLAITLNDPSGSRKVFNYELDANRKFHRAIHCFVPSSAAEVSCRTPCSPGSVSTPEFVDRCAAASRHTRIAAAREHDVISYNAKGSRFVELRLSRIPSGANVLITCTYKRTLGGGTCPFVADAVVPRGHSANLAYHLGNVRLKVGTILDLWLTRGDQISDVVRFKIRRDRLPKASKLCVGPSQTAPGPC